MEHGHVAEHIQGVQQIEMWASSHMRLPRVHSKSVEEKRLARRLYKWRGCGSLSDDASSRLDAVVVNYSDHALRQKDYIACVDRSLACKAAVEKSRSEQEPQKESHKDAVDAFKASHVDFVRMSEDMHEWKLKILEECWALSSKLGLCCNVC